MCVNPLHCSNRTFMELKCLKRVKRAHNIRSSNRTFMELKFISAGRLWSLRKF